MSTVTKFVGLKELRQNMAKLTKEASKKQHRLIILKKNVPLFELRPLAAEDLKLVEFERDIEAARLSVKKGKTYSTEQVREMLGLDPL